jgi:Domain of unknown function (DUF4326)
MSRVVHYKSGEPYDYYVGRPTFFGNPWSHKKGTQASFVVKTQQEAVENFRSWLNGAAFIDVLPDKRQMILKCVHTLRGKILACWCFDGEPCHAKVLAEMANSG